MNTVYFGKLDFELWEFVMIPVYLFVIWFISSWIKNIRLKEHPEYKYFLWGIYAKIIGGIALGLIYAYYYKGGDTLYYYQSGLAITNLFYKDPVAAMKVLFSAPQRELIWLFDNDTGYPIWYIYKNPNTFMVVRLITPLLILSMKSYILTTILVAWISYFGIWKLYRCLCNLYPNLSNYLAMAIIFLPSAVFWGSGIMKDTITYAATCWFITGVYNVFIHRNKFFWNLINMVITGALIILIKPYILVALLPSCLLWIIVVKVKNIRNQLLSTIFYPMAILLAISLGFGTLGQMNSFLGSYAPDKLLDKAITTQNDLKQDYYGSNKFDLSVQDNSFVSILKAAPTAIIAGIYRPFIWESKNILMILSGLENLVILILTVLVLINSRITGLLKLVIREPIVLFIFVYSLVFAFSLGFTTPNFGALVRFKIPFLPLFTAMLIIILAYFKKNPVITQRSRRS